MQILDGRTVAEANRVKLKTRAEKLKGVLKREPGLAVVLVGDDPASKVYVANKIKACAQVGIHSTEIRLAENTEMHELKAAIEKLNHDANVDGILLQLPLPRQLDKDVAINWIHPSKDADCLTQENLGRLWSGRPLTKPCTPWGVMVILAHYGIDVRGLDTVVVGRSNIVGKPMAHLLSEANATVTVCHSKTKDLRAHLKRADLVVIAAGKAEFLGGEDFKKDSIVIDVGIHRKPSPNKSKSILCGDVRAKELDGVAKAITPVPGGVGPMTITMLLENTIRLAEERLP